MIKHRTLRVAVVVMTMLCGIPSQATDFAQKPWAIKLNVGLSALTQDIASSTSGSMGPTIGLDFAYAVSKAFSVGFDTSWETHTATSSGIDLGDIDTFSLMPKVECRFVQTNKFIAYGAFALGMNINIFSVSSAVQAVAPGIVLTPSNSFAVKPSLGVAYFVSDAWALDANLGWKWNSGSFSNNRVVVTTGNDFDASAFQLAVGAGYHF